MIRIKNLKIEPLGKEEVLMKFDVFSDDLHKATIYKTLSSEIWANSTLTIVELLTEEAFNIVKSKGYE